MAKQITLIAKLKGAQKAKSGLKGINSSLTNLAQAAFTVGTAMKAIELVKLAGQSEALARGFKNLSKASGFSAQALDKLRSATDGTMSSMELMKQANTAMLLGIAESEDQMADMFDVAQRLASALGQDTAIGIESLVTGLGRQSKLMLDNLGIMVDVENATKEYAKALGKTVSELTDAERKQAFVNEAMKEANTLVKSLGEEHLTTADRMKQTTAAVDDMKTEIGIALTPIIENAAKAATLLARKLRFALDPSNVRIDDLKIVIARLQAHLTQMAEDPTFTDKLKNMFGGDVLMMERLKLYEDELERLQSILSTTGNVIVSEFLPAQKKTIEMAGLMSQALGTAFDPDLGAGEAFRGFVIQLMSLMQGVILASKAVSQALTFTFTGPLGIGAAISALVALEAAKAGVRSVKFAQGGDFVTSGPQMIMVGDNPGGKERVQVTPLSSPNIEGPQGGNIHLHFGAVTNEDYVKDFIVPEIQKAQRLNLA